MAEDAEGVVFLKRDIEKVRDALKSFSKSFIRELNDKWAAFFVPDRYYLPEVQAKLLDMSRDIPLLYYLDTEDYGWVFRLYWQGSVKASLEVNYELFEELMSDNPEAIDEHYANANFEAFNAFDLGDEQLQGLKTEISAQAFLAKDDIWEMSDKSEFIRLVGIDEIWAMTYRYLAATSGDAESLKRQDDPN